MLRLLSRHLPLFSPSPQTLISSSATADANSVPSLFRTVTRAFSYKPFWSPPPPDSEWGEERRASETNREGPPVQHIVYINPRKNNTFVTISDSDGKKKFSASVGSLHLGKGTNIPRFFAEPVAEHAGKQAVKLEIKSAVVKVKGSVFFKKKKDAILGFKKGIRSGGVDQCKIMSIQDTTKLAHNGCRLRKKRRI